MYNMTAKIGFKFNKRSPLAFVHSPYRLVLVCHMCGTSVFRRGSCWETNIAPVKTDTHSEIRA